MEALTTRRVVRGDLTLEVVEPPCAGLWDFWGRFADRTWEPETFEVLDRMLTPTGTYVDVGAWVGPTVLYAAPRCGHVLAVEPDPVAFDQLRHNLDLNPAGDVTLAQGAVHDHRDGVLLFCQELWGCSTSSVTHPSDHYVFVPSWTLADLVAPLENVELVKIDIEGGECRVVPEAVGFLAERRIPCLVSLHEPLWEPGTDTLMSDALNRFDRVTRVDRDAPAPYRTVLCEWT